jgi:hypothetical protein
MTGAAERPNPTASTATGTAEIVFVSADSLRFKITGTGLTNLTAGHFHAVNNTTTNAGPVVFGFFASNPAQPTFSGTVAEGFITRQSTFSGITGFNFDSLVTRLRAATPTIYANLHTTANPGGDIRGDMVKVVQ